MTDKEYYEQNKEILKQKRRERYSQNKESERAKRKEYYYLNQEKERESSKKRMSERFNDPIFKQQILNQQKEYYYKNKEIINQKNKERWNKNKEKYNLTQRINQPIRSRKVKEDVLTHYGNGKLACVCCGQEGLMFLTLDHINGRTDGEKGGKRRKSAGIKLWRSAQIQGYPPIYQTLCWNCNSAKHINKGICPHKNQQKL